MMLRSPEPMFSIRNDMSDISKEDSLALYEATGYRRLEEAYRIHDEDYSPDTDTSESSDSSSSRNTYGTTSDSESENREYSDKQRLLKEDNSSWSEYSEEEDDQDEDAEDDESEDEITHEPVSAKEVNEHNKLFGRETKDFWWVCNGKVYSDNFVALLRPMTLQEITESTKEEIVDLRRELANSTPLTNTMEDFDKVLSRYLIVLNRQPSIPQGDPNLLPFPTPFDFIPTDMRKWISTWEPFDFEVTPWPCIDTKPVPMEDSHDILVKTLRPWLDNWKPLDMEIDGECGWICIEPCLFERDILTKNQEKILEERKNRTDMNDIDRMARRRRSLANYFRIKYHKSDAEMKIYSTFAQSLEQSFIKFLSLC